MAVERLGSPLPFLRQLCAVGGATRDPRAPWSLSVVYRALLPSALPAFEAGKRLAELQWRPADAAAADRRLAFDHARLIAAAVEATRAEIDELRLPAGVLPDAFTLGELQALCEAILGRPLDKSSFRRRLAARELVQPVDGAQRGGACRPAQLFRLRKA